MSFEDVMLERLAECHAEACEEVIASMKSGRSISDAVTDAIEVLPASKTRELRRWLEDWEAWEEWHAFKKRGWKIGRSSYNKKVLYLTPPEGTPESATLPSERAIAAGANVRDVMQTSRNVSIAWNASTKHTDEILKEVTYHVR